MQRSVFDEGVGGGVPNRIASCLKGGTQSAGGKTGSIRFSLNEFFSRKLHDDFAVAGRGNKTVVFSCRCSRHRLEPMGKVGRTFFDSPIFHGICDHIGDVAFQVRALRHRFLECLIDFLRQPFLHNCVVEDHAAE
jgi:hypothetical protein